MVHADASSSLSVSRYISVVITGIKQALNGVYEVTPDSGPAFFLRKEYLSSQEDAALLECGAVVEGEAEVSLMEASLVFSVEKAAMSYLARCEHCRAGLKLKLLKKKLPARCIDAALDFLEAEGYLDDERFAGAWLRNRSIDHNEGRVRVVSELLSRGVSLACANKAADEFFSENDEVQICRRALNKLLKTGREGDKITASLLRSGFSMNVIKASRSEENYG